MRLYEEEEQALMRSLLRKQSSSTSHDELPDFYVGISLSACNIFNWSEVRTCKGLLSKRKKW